MRILVFFHLPVVSLEEKRAYRMFRKFLLQSGFLMMQESVYSKLVLNTTAAHAMMMRIRENSPRQGLIQMLMVTEKQYGNIELVIGNMESEVINTTDRLVIL